MDDINPTADLFKYGVNDLVSRVQPQPLVPAIKQAQIRNPS